MRKYQIECAGVRSGPPKSGEAGLYVVMMGRYEVLVAFDDNGAISWTEGWTAAQVREALTNGAERHGPIEIRMTDAQAVTISLSSFPPVRLDGDVEKFPNDPIAVAASCLRENGYPCDRVHVKAAHESARLLVRTDSSLIVVLWCRTRKAVVQGKGPAIVRENVKSVLRSLGWRIK